MDWDAYLHGIGRNPVTFQIAGLPAGLTLCAPAGMSKKAIDKIKVIYS